MAELTIKGNFVPNQRPERVQDFLIMAEESQEFIAAPGKLTCTYVPSLRQHQIDENTTGISEQRLRQIFDNDELNFLV
ncbi:hypothetical protein D1013_08940 [Euzebyella marina]|uniref:Uncharacterized protein n=1 Tax=Euzebyella marina TaxID=1761453 RepID=A0A3G2L5E2_9FLAO|nr:MULTISPECIES: hypothetical protein [Flavobacteriaceae]AYN67477.1 hypothetical protein D1013_08940 [Euzebyella marina]CAG2532803.1 hypothetical protein MAR621_02997 [Maribacter dokdonensis]